MVNLTLNPDETKRKKVDIKRRKSRSSGSAVSQLSGSTNVHGGRLPSHSDTEMATTH